MRYIDYMNEFTVIDETKAVLLSRMRQRVKQLNAAQIKRERTSIAVVTPKKANTFKLYPKRWIAVLTSIALVATAAPIVYFTIPKNGGTPDNIVENNPGNTPGNTPGDTPGDTTDTYYTLSLDYMKNLKVDVEGVTAYGIRRNLGATQNADTGKAKKTASTFAAKFADEPETPAAEPNYYLYSTNENYEYGNVEYDSKGIQKVTFVKNTEVTEDVYDANGKIIDSNRKMTQEELNGQINKIYTTKEYTFIQFVPILESPEGDSPYSNYYPYKDKNGNIQQESVTVRPKVMTYDENGVAEFDKTDYYSSNLTASFVIDNTTGYIYKIENFHILSFRNGLVQGNDKYYYSISTDKEHNLIFTDVLPNKSVSVQNVFMDKYGWIYVANDKIEDVDDERKIVYTTQGEKYAIDSDRNVYCVGLKITHKIVDGNKEPYENHGILRVSCLYYLYSFSNHKDIIMYDEFVVRNDHVPADNPDSKFRLNISGADTTPRWFDNNYDTIITLSKNKLYYLRVDLHTFPDEKILLTVDKDFIQLSDLTLYEDKNYYMTIGNDRYKIDNVYYHTDTTKTSYYHIVQTVTGVELVELTSKTYTDNVFIFQPINK